MREINYAASWTKTGCICGLAGVLFYFAAAFIPMPPLPVYIAAFAFGPLLAIGCAGLFYFLIPDDYSPRVMIATASGIAAGCVLLIMLTVQQSLFAIMDKHSIGNTSANTDYKYISDGLNSIHFGMDIAWDILISVATVLFGYSLTKKSLYWKILGIAGLLSGVLLLSFNLYHFPNPPDSVGSIDWGPLVALWYIVLFSSIVWLFIGKRRIK